MKVFISGSISINKLPIKAIQKLDSIINRNFTVLVGDAKGVDSEVQKYLFNKNYSNVVVYFVGDNARNKVGNWDTKYISSDTIKKGREYYTLKDIAMAKEADYALMIWDGKSKGTLNNIINMKNQNKKFFVVFNNSLIDEKNIETLINKNTKKHNYQLNLF